MMRWVGAHENKTQEHIDHNNLTHHTMTDQSHASPRAFIGDDYPWHRRANDARAPFYKYETEERWTSLVEYVDDLAEVHFCLQNRVTFPARTGWVAAVIARQCTPIWQGLDSGQLRPVLIRKVEALGKHPSAEKDYHSVSEREDSFYVGVRMRGDGWGPVFDEWAPPERPTRSSAWSRIMGHASDREMSAPVRDRLDANWACDHVSEWPKVPYGVKIAVERYCAATMSERSNWAGMRRSS
ncbi:hypothetical protein pqer_cds_705 [Pandoravirus quercus]|uniref:Uncharacterized protein n=2 Tax=Pandoravirus TaxID=2060084 RepID=A0A2U7U9K3_9VIRU|nr:hypothetical protein pqer_cds_705 [Pandoravirus quercus]AVK75127.1 hypothetical protein pqer_cds_705 [Pandoravirus quercus]QBZ81290.1 hypothetical protein pclt_cds_703 [Pandoravirus celtis]